MKNERLIAYILIAVGAVTLLSRLGDADWLWIALVAGALLAGYVTRKNYGFLVAGSVFAGLAVGEIIGTPSGTLISLGVGFFVVDRIEPRPNRWALYLAGTLAGIGLFIGIGHLLNSFWVALIFIAGGAYLLLREREDKPVTAPSGSPQSTSEPAAADSTRADAPTDAPADTPVDVTKNASTEGAQNASPKDVAADQTHRPTESNPALDEPELNEDERERYRLLEVWRRETSKSEGRPAYIVLRNESLRQIAQNNPQTLEELDKVKGIGPVKLEQYGDAILHVIRGEAPPSSAS